MHKVSVIAAALCVSCFALATPAIAQTTNVHLEADPTVALERVDDDGRATMACHAPCDMNVDFGARYRIDGGGIRPSESFRLGSPGGRIFLRADTRSSAVLPVGTVLTVLGVGFLGGGIAATVWAMSRGPIDGAVWMLILAAPLFAASLATGIPGIFLLASSRPSTVSQRLDIAEMHIRTPAFTQVPVLSATF